MLYQRADAEGIQRALSHEADLAANWVTDPAEFAGQASLSELRLPEASPGRVIAEAKRYTDLSACVAVER